MDERMAHGAREAEEPVTRHKKSSEAAIQREIVLWLRARGCVVAITDASVGLGCAGIPTGWPDITGLLPGGRFLSIEVKSARGRQTPEQKDYQARIGAAGGIYILARSLAAVQESLRYYVFRA
jgi:hypothetical protein